MAEDLFLTMDDFHSGLRLLHALKEQKVEILSAFWRAREMSWSFTMVIPDDSGGGLVAAQKQIDETIELLERQNRRNATFTIKFFTLIGKDHPYAAKALEIQDMIAEPPPMGDLYIYPKHLLYREPVEA